MKKLILLALAGLLSLPALAYPGPATLKVDSRPVRVSVYPDRALVTRKASLKLTPGDYKVEFPDLPGSLMADSVRVTGKGSAKARIGTVETRSVYLEASASDEVRRLQDELQRLTDEDNSLSDAYAIANRQRDFYQAIQFHNAEVWSKEITVGRLTVEDWAKVVSFLGDGQKAQASQSRMIEVTRRDLKAKADALQKKLGEYLSQNAKQMTYASVEVSASTEGSLDLELGYVVIGATWGPTYEARADIDKGEVELTYMGQVTQRTAEDWSGVELALSTAKPAVGAAPPEMYPWFLRLYEPVMLMGRAEGGMAKSKAMRMDAVGEEKDELQHYGEVNAPAPMPAEVMTAEAVATGPTVMFKTATKQDIPADGAAHKVTISVDWFKSEFEYYAVPKLMQYAYLRGVLTNDREYPLLAGPVSVFINDDYLGRSALPLTASGEKLELALGVDEGIKVKRELMKREEEDAGLTSKDRRVTLAYKVTVESFKKAAHKMTMVDQIPVSQQEEIVVKEIKIAPAPTERDEKGKLTWKFEVAPKEKKEFWIEFSVRYPKDRVVQGM